MEMTAFPDDYVFAAKNCTFDGTVSAVCVAVQWAASGDWTSVLGGRFTSTYHSFTSFDVPITANAEALAQTCTPSLVTASPVSNGSRAGRKANWISALAVALVAMCMHVA